MAVAKVGSTGTKLDGTGTAHTLSYALNASANFLLVRIGYNFNIATISSVVWEPAGVNQALTLIGTAIQNGDSQGVALYRLVSPTTGTRNLVVTTSAAYSGLTFTADGYSGVDTSTPTSGFQSDNPNAAASPTDLPAITSAVGDLVIDAINYDTAATMTSGQTEDAFLNETAFGPFKLSVSRAAGAASVTMSYTYSGTIAYAMAGVNLKATAGSASVSPSVSPSVSLSVSPSASVSASPSAGPFTIIGRSVLDYGE